MGGHRGRGGRVHAGACRPARSGRSDRRGRSRRSRARDECGSRGVSLPGDAPDDADRRLRERRAAAARRARRPRRARRREQPPFPGTRPAGAGRPIAGRAAPTGWPVRRRRVRRRSRQSAGCPIRSAIDRGRAWPWRRVWPGRARSGACAVASSVRSTRRRANGPDRRQASPAPHVPLRTRRDDRFEVGTPGTPARQPHRRPRPRARRCPWTEATTTNRQPPRPNEPRRSHWNGMTSRHCRLP